MKRLFSLLFLIIFLFSPVLVLAQAPPVQNDVTITVTVPTGEIPPLPPIIPPIGPVPTKIIFEGKAYPFAYLTLLKNGRVAATFNADNLGLFSKELTGISGGDYTFALWAEDTEGRKSTTASIKG